MTRTQPAMAVRDLIGASLVRYRADQDRELLTFLPNAFYKLRELRVAFDVEPVSNERGDNRRRIELLGRLELRA